MSKRRYGNYPTRSSSSERHRTTSSSTSDRYRTEEHRRPYPDRVSGSVRPEPEARREYDNDNRRYCDGGRDRQPLKLSGLRAGLPLSDSTSMKFEWNNLLAKKPDSSNPTANPGLNRRCFGFSDENDASRINAENGYGGGYAKSGVSDLGVDPRSKYGYFHGGLTSPLGQSHASVPKVDDFRHRDHHPYMGQQGKAVFVSGPGCSGGLMECFPGHSDEFNRSREMAVRPIGLSGYSQGQTPQLNELGASYNVQGLKRKEIGDMGSLSILDLLYKKMRNGVGEGNRPPSCSRPSIVESIDGGNGALRAGTQEVSQWNHCPNFTEQAQPTIPSYDEVLGSGSRTRGFGFGGDDGLERGLEALSYESTLGRLALLEGDQGLDDMTTLQMCAMRKRALAKRLRTNESKSELFHDLSASCNVPDLSYGDNPGNDDDFEQYAISGEGQLNIDQAGTCGEDQWNTVQDVKFGEYQLNINHNVNFGEDQLNINQSLNFGEDQRNVDRDEMYGENQWNIDQDVSYGAEQWNAEDINKLNFDNVLPSNELPAPMQEHHDEQFKSARVGVKRRLGPLTSPGSIKKRLGPLKSPGIEKKRLGPSESPASVKKRLEPLKSPGSVKKRLGPAQNAPNLNFLGPKLQDQTKSGIRETDDISGSIHSQGDGLPKVKEKPAKEELPEDSEEFKKLVDSAFIKYTQELNEKPALRRKFMQEGSFTTECCVCASNSANSKEFSGTVPLATHAFCSKGFRAEHLGFHKALCVLLGWDSAAVSNRTWVQRILPEAEALALKEDIIIWPPVVVIHNSSIANEIADEVLEGILTDIGFGGGKLKVCRGKPANQSIMVVTFNPKYSGLQEAERLHKLFADNKHGRVEFQQISSAALSNSSEGNRNPLADEVNCLYGYLGIAEDLDKLESETKKWWRVKSKKEIQAIANTSL